MTGYFDRQIEEIRKDTALRIYGAFLSLCHVFAAMNWIQKGQYKNLSTAGEALCWPFFENCFAYRYLNEQQVLAVFVAFLAMALIGSLLFFRNARVQQPIGFKSR